MNFPEPRTIPEYQHELVRAWGAVLRVEDKAQVIADELQLLATQFTSLARHADELKRILSSLKHHAA